MNRFNRSVLAAAVVGGLCGGIGLAQAASSSNVPTAQRLDDEHWKYPHMHHAMASLREARKDLDSAEDIFRGHRQDAIDHVEAAIKTIQEGLKEQRDEEATVPTVAPSVSNLADPSYPHMRHALERLKDAKAELEAAEHIFAGHRDEAISHTDKAIKQIEDGLHDADR
jgi:hypothetical protein